MKYTRTIGQLASWTFQTSIHLFVIFNQGREILLSCDMETIAPTATGIRTEEEENPTETYSLIQVINYVLLWKLSHLALLSPDLMPWVFKIQNLLFLTGIKKSTYLIHSWHFLNCFSYNHFIPCCTCCTEIDFPGSLSILNRKLGFYKALCKIGYLKNCRTSFLKYFWFVFSFQTTEYWKN